MEKDVVITNPEKLEKVKKLISEAGPEKLHVLADFDRTLTKAFVGGRLIPSITSILRDGNYLTPDYTSKARALFDKYHPIEIEPKVPLPEKKKLMEEWWLTHFDLLIKSGLNKKDLENVVDSAKIKLRDGFLEFADFLKEHNIPLIIMSSSGLGGDIISMYLEKNIGKNNNIHIISNVLQWGEKGEAAAVRRPIIHVMNKDETMVKNFPCFGAVKNRKNVLLLGDNLSDVGMIIGFDYDNLIKIGFLNEKAEESLEQYKKNYDVVILNDSSFDYVNKLLKELIK